MGFVHWSEPANQTAQTDQQGNPFHGGEGGGEQDQIWISYSLGPYPYVAEQHQPHFSEHIHSNTHDHDHTHRIQCSHLNVRIS